MTARARTLQRHAAGLAVAPLVVPAAWVLFSLSMVSPDAPSAFQAAVVRDALGSAVFPLAPLAYGGALLLGVPILLVLRGAGRLALAWLVPVATAVAALAATVLALAIGCDSGGCAEEECPWLLVAAVPAFLGAAVAFVHGLVAGLPLHRAASPAEPAAEAP